MVIVTVAFVIAIIFSVLLTGGLFGLSTFDINLRDTYFVAKFSWSILVLFPMSLLTLLIYAIRSGNNQFKNRLQNIILTSSIFLVIVSLLRIYKFAAFFELMIPANNNNGWTIYPPLSALPKVSHPAHSQPSHPITHGILIILIFFLLMLVICAMLTGKNWNTNKHEQANS